MANHQIHNERIKLGATYLNGIAIALFAVGGLAPLLSGFYGNVEPGPLLPVVSGICILASVALHFYARRSLKGLRS